MTATNNSEQFVNELVNELIKTESQTLNERINNNFVDLNNYLKHDGGKGRKTGKALLINKTQIYPSSILTLTNRITKNKRN